jgi:hypothetical protein
MEAEFIAIVNVLPLLENRTFVPRLIFHLYWVYLPFVPVGATNRYKCPITKARRGLSIPPCTDASYLYQLVALLGTNVMSSHLYQVKTPPDTNVGTFVPVRVLARYKCAMAIVPSSSPCPSPLPTLLLPLSNSSSPSPMAP